MKYSLFLIVVVVATARNVLTDDTSDEETGKQLDACKNKNSWTYTHNVPHESNPHQFYKCLGEFGFLQTCPTLKGVPLVFNHVALVCDWEDGLPDGTDGPDGPGGTDGTGGPGSSTSPTTPRPIPPEPNCSDEPDKKKPHKDCHKYYQCVNGVPQEKECPEGLNFDLSVMECAYVEC